MEVSSVWQALLQARILAMKVMLRIEYLIGIIKVTNSRNKILFAVPKFIVYDGYRSQKIVKLEENMENRQMYVKKM